MMDVTYELLSFRFVTTGSLLLITNQDNRANIRIIPLTLEAKVELNIRLFIIQ